MKLQIRNESLRLRVDEAELATLLDGGTLRISPRLGDRTIVDFSLDLGDRLAFEPTGGWRISIPRDVVLAYIETLPRRDALTFALDAGGIELQFEIDVRDSLAHRGPRRRSG